MEPSLRSLFNRASNRASLPGQVARAGQVVLVVETGLASATAFTYVIPSWAYRSLGNKDGEADTIASN